MIIISIGGSLISPTDHSGKTIGMIDVRYLKKFRAMILELVKTGQRFLLVTGGGGPSRAYARSAAILHTKATADDLHWIGIAATKLNAEFFRVLFTPWSHPVIVEDPTVKLPIKKSILIAAGWKPGCSTDMDAVILAKTYGAEQVINLTNVDYVYSADPRKDPKAVAYPDLSWKQYKKVLGMKTFRPSAHAPFDPVASAFSERHGLTVTIMNGTTLSNVRRAINGERFQGTLLHP